MKKKNNNTNHHQEVRKTVYFLNMAEKYTDNYSMIGLLQVSVFQ